ncbi:hypothetical protein MTO96_002206 [Rhipicephalus appendiculatus]
MCKFESTLSPFGPRNLLQVAMPPKSSPFLVQHSPCWTCFEECQPSQLLRSSRSTPWFAYSPSGDACGSAPSNPYPYSSRTHQDGERDFASIFQDTAATESSRTFAGDGGRQYVVGRDVGRRQTWTRAREFKLHRSFAEVQLRRGRQGGTSTAAPAVCRPRVVGRDSRSHGCRRRATPSRT